MTTVAQFDVEFTRILDEAGELVGSVPDSLSDPQSLVPLYRLMVLTRAFDAKAISLQRTGQLGTYASSLGQEAIGTGVGTAMRSDDVLAPTYREQAAQFAHGVAMSDLLIYWGGDERGSDWSGPAHDFPICVPIATQCLHAAGAALAYKLRGEKRVAVTVVGDGGSSKGDFLEAINAASAFELPLVLVIVNNQWAISVPRSKQNRAKTLAQKGIGGGLPSLQADGNDVIAARWVMQEAIEQARSGKGATVVELITYRLSDHTTADDATRYRGGDEVDAAWKREPIMRLRNYLMSENEWDEEREAALEAEAVEAVNVAVEEYLALGKPSIESMFDYMYAELPHDLAAQRERALEELK